MKTYETTSAFKKHSENRLIVNPNMYKSIIKRTPRKVPNHLYIDKDVMDTFLFASRNVQRLPNSINRSAVFIFD